MKIVDSHIHFWQPTHLRYGWLDEVPPINRAFLPENLLAQTGEHSLEKIVFVQAGAHPEDAMAEVKWVSELAETHPQIQGIVADAALENGAAVEAHLAELQNYPLVKGVRRLIQGEADGFCFSAEFIQSTNLLPKYNFTFDICAIHQLPDVLHLVAACPDVNFVLDHFGKPAIKDGLLDPWRDQISQLASFKNVRCKLSGLITEAGHDNWQPADLQPYIDHVLEAFGANRLMYGGDWPVSLLASKSWSDWVTVAQNAISHLDEDEQHKIFYQNAIDFYALDSG